MRLSRSLTWLVPGVLSLSAMTFATNSEQKQSEDFAEGFPKQYESWASTEGGSVDDMLASDPRLVVLWAGYGFSKDYNAPRGHMNAVTDIRNTLRTGAPGADDEGPMPMACWSCKSPDVPKQMELEGYQEFFVGKWARSGDKINDPIGCIDCHDADSPEMARVITRPYLHNGLKAAGHDVEKATENDMNSLTCAQCHVEYYFDDTTKEVVFPWFNGTQVEQIESHFDEIEFSDWTHAISKAPMLKAQHPDWELWQEGVHGKNNVACVDCHSPATREKGVTSTDHKIQNPLANIEQACQSCHTQSKEYFLDVVSSYKEKSTNLRLKAEDLLVKAHIEAGAAWAAGATEQEMQSALKLIRSAQWRWDYAAASHGGFFHAPEETLRVFGIAIERAGEARLELGRILTRRGVEQPIEMPDLSTKEKAQAFIGLDMEALREEKEQFKKSVLPVWDSAAEEGEKAD